MILLALVMAQAAATYTYDGVRAMPTEALADALLGPDHGPIAKVNIAGGGFVQRIDGLTSVTFVGTPAAAPERAGWCRQVVNLISFEPAEPQARLTPATPTRISSTMRTPFYRLARGDCAEAKAIFFPIRTRDEGEFALMDRVLAARALARGKAPLPFAVTCTDEAGTHKGVEGGDRCREGAGRALLAALPLEDAFNVEPAGNRYRWNGSDRPATPEPHDAEITMSHDIQVHATIAERDGKITAIALRRMFTPPP